MGMSVKVKALKFHVYEGPKEKDAEYSVSVEDAKILSDTKKVEILKPEKATKDAQ